MKKFHECSTLVGTKVVVEGSTRDVWPGPPHHGRVWPVCGGRRHFLCFTFVRITANVTASVCRFIELCINFFCVLVEHYLYNDFFIRKSFDCFSLYV